MAITLNRICIMAEKKYGMKLIAGKSGLENPVRWVHMVEDAQVPDFLHGSELIFTTGIAHRDEEFLIDFVKSLKENKSSGLVINMGPYIKTIPPHVIVYCEQNDFPLFTVPWETRLIDLTYEICRIVINDEKTEQSLSETFKNLILNPENKSGYVSALRKMGFSENSSYNLITLKFLIDGNTLNAKLLNEIKLSFAKITKINPLQRGIFIWDKTMVLVYQNISEEEIIGLKNSIEENIHNTDGVKVFMGVSDKIEGYQNLCEIYSQSKSALEVASLKKENCVFYKDIGVYKILFDVKNKELLSGYYKSVLGALIEYDIENKSDLCSILRQYILYDGSIQKVAEINLTHRNTINYKIKKIKEIMGTDLSIKSSSDILLAFIISEIIDKEN